MAKKSVSHQRRNLTKSMLNSMNFRENSQVLSRALPTTAAKDSLTSDSLTFDYGTTVFKKVETLELDINPNTPKILKENQFASPLENFKNFRKAFISGGKNFQGTLDKLTPEDFKYKDDKGVTLFHELVEYGTPKMVKVYIKNLQEKDLNVKQIIDTPDLDGRTPLWWILQNSDMGLEKDNREKAEILIKNGANISHVNEDKKSLIDVAKTMIVEDLKDFLIEKNLEQESNMIRKKTKKESNLAEPDTIKNLNITSSQISSSTTNLPKNKFYDKKSYMAIKPGRVKENISKFENILNNPNSRQVDKREPLKRLDKVNKYNFDKNTNPQKKGFNR